MLSSIQHTPQATTVMQQNQTTQPPYHGQCLCGAVQYEVDAFSSRMGHCHCSMCRKFSGAAFATFGAARVEDFRWLKGESELNSYVGVNGTTRRFCQHCGSSMTFSPSNDDGALIEVTLGTLDNPINQQPDAHIFVGSKSSWYPIGDDLPQFENSRDSKQIK